jgi:hypothetical protein
LERSAGSVPAAARAAFAPAFMDVALWMSPDVLRHKLAARDERNPEAAWNVSRLPAGLGRPGAVDRLFVASAGAYVDRDLSDLLREGPRTPRPDRGCSAGARGSAVLKETL